jgi:hypothetical protein
MAPPSASPTTRSGSAAQVLGPAMPRKAGKLGVWVGVGALLFALAGTGVFVAMRGSDREPAGEPAASSVPAPPKPAAAPVVAPPPAVTTEPACADGQTRSDDTRGHCCWPGQAWSTSKARCVGAPSCPHGTKPRGEQCAAVAAEIASTLVPSHAPEVHDPSKRATAPELALNAKTYAPGATIEIRFASPISSATNSRAWVTVAKAGTPPTSYGTWKYVDDGATTASLVAPTTSGSYEIRLHTNYPTQAFNVARTAALVVGEVAAVVEPGVTPPSQQRFSVVNPTLHGGVEVEITFPTALHAAPGERFWVTVVAADAADDRYGKWDYVADGARHFKLAVPTAAGDYEVRLHANYPKKSTNVVFRARIHVDPT